MTALTALYLSVVLYCFATWFKVFHLDTDSSPPQKRLALKVLIVGCIFWPIVVPLSKLEKGTLAQ